MKSTRDLLADSLASLRVLDGGVDNRDDALEYLDSLFDGPDGGYPFGADFFEIDLETVYSEYKTHLDDLGVEF